MAPSSLPSSLRVAALRLPGAFAGSHVQKGDTDMGVLAGALFVGLIQVDVTSLLEIFSMQFPLCPSSFSHQLYCVSESPARLDASLSFLSNVGSEYLDIGKFEKACGVGPEEEIFALQFKWRLIRPSVFSYSPAAAMAWPCHQRFCGRSKKDMIDRTVHSKKNHHKVWTSYQDTFRRLKMSGHNGGSDGDGMVDEGAAVGYTHMRARRGEATDCHKHCTDGIYVLACFFSRLR
ncbi:hypothetical protein QYE76_026279 [Lolium multiflorum]|uniref:Uncharacterized protein n=1 Tax=Lolium multiflorum TaxID=4521 RepID=A0AAD8VV00_LOLMU|nr:hypothetical protein QYE76_026279 [Lolium multiflorum]